MGHAAIPAAAKIPIELNYTIEYQLFTSFKYPLFPSIFFFTFLLLFARLPQSGALLRCGRGQSDAMPWHGHHDCQEQL